MTFRVTDQDLKVAVERLNELSKRTYRLDGSYGKVHLVVMEKGTSINNVSNMNTKKELYYQLHTILNYLERESKEVV